MTRRSVVPYDDHRLTLFLLHLRLSVKRLRSLFNKHRLCKWRPEPNRPWTCVQRQ